MSQQITCSDGFVDVEDGKIYFVIYQPESDSSNNTPLILIHGGPGFTHHYLEPLYGLARERPIVFYDQLGCGKSDRPRTLEYCRVDRFVSELASLIEHLKFSSVSLLGHSWGSAIAAEYSISNQKVSHLVLASPYLSTPIWNEDIVRYKSALPKYMRAAIETGDYSSESFLTAHHEYYKCHVYGSAESDRSITLSAEEASSEVYNKMWGLDEFSITGVLRDYDCTPRINKISAKTLLTCGEFDTASPRACKILSNKIRGSQVKVFKNSAHFPHLENKLEYVECLRRFLNEKQILKGNFLSRWFVNVL